MERVGPGPARELVGSSVFSSADLRTSGLAPRRSPAIPLQERWNGSKDETRSVWILRRQVSSAQTIESRKHERTKTRKNGKENQALLNVLVFCFFRVFVFSCFRDSIPCRSNRYFRVIREEVCSVATSSGARSRNVFRWPSRRNGERVLTVRAQATPVVDQALGLCSHRRRPPTKALRLSPMRQKGGNSSIFLTLPPPNTT